VYKTEIFNHISSCVSRKDPFCSLLLHTPRVNDQWP